MIDSTFPGGGEMGALMRSIDWDATPLGPVEGWPRSLRTVLGLLLGSEVAVFALWGPDLVQFYNDAARPILGDKHPAAMGQRARDCWSEIWEVIAPMYAHVLGGGATRITDGVLFLDRHGFPEECYFDYAYSPLRGDDDAVCGIYAAVAETTRRVIGDRRLDLARELSLRAAAEETVDGLLRATAEVLAGASADLPFALVYRVQGDTATLVACAGLASECAAAPETIDLAADGAWPIAAVVQSGEEAVVADLPARFGPLVGKAWPEPVTRALVMPLAMGGADDGVLVAGLSPRLLLDDDYRGFLQLLARQLTASITSTRALEQEQQRAAQLAELDRQKTAFFSNVSHELRTPLTLILGPTEEALASPGRALGGAQLERVHGNAERLLKLVNTLLEFSRVQDGQARARFQPTDLATLTAALANAFESVIATAGLELVVACEALPEPIWVDPALWEKVVLNLVSNAFKFTLAGRVAVRLRWTGDGVELEVDDTGVGIPAEELPRIFERFHRVERAGGRSHEGTGIGLSLVRELVTLHGGEVEVQSSPGVGSRFTVRLPAGRAHLPADATAEEPTGGAASSAAAFVREAGHWLPASADEEQAVPSGDAGPRLLLADDNAEMRAHLRRILAPHFSVEAVTNGEDALAAARVRVPDVVLSDVMMPGLDGMALVRALRGDPRTAHVPIVLLSARAGEEATVTGLATGADDYVVKPFGARELVARLQAAVKVARADRERRRAHERVAEVVEVMGDGFFSVDPAWTITAVNPSFERMMRRRRDEVVGRSLWEIFPASIDAGTQYGTQAARCMRERVPVQFVDRYPPLGLWTDIRAQPTPDGGMAVFIRDVTAEKEAELVRAGNAEFEQHLIGIVSHDLRNPLNVISLGASVLVDRSDLDDRVRATVVRIRTAANRAVRLVNDLLDFTQARLGGGIPIQPIPTDAHAVAHAAVTDVELTFPGREVKLEQAGDGSGIWDQDRLGQAIQNLVTNALKYSPAGTPVRVTSRAEPDEIVIAIHNAGPPIPDAIRLHLFEPFKRGPKTDIASRSVGLGLYIVKQVVDAHGGRIDVTSTAADGTTFVMRLPRSPR